MENCLWHEEKQQEESRGNREQVSKTNCVTDAKIWGKGN